MSDTICAWMRQIATRSGTTVSNPKTPGGSASAPDTAAAREAARRAIAFAAAAGASAVFSRLGGTCAISSSTAFTMLSTRGCTARKYVDAMVIRGSRGHCQYTGYNPGNKPWWEGRMQGNACVRDDGRAHDA